jgi:hypothetical protein
MILFKSRLLIEFTSFHIAICKAPAEEETDQIQPFKAVLCYSTDNIYSKPQILASSAEDVSIDAAVVSLLNLLTAVMDEKKDDKLGSMRSKSIIYGGDNFSVGCIDLADLD